MNTPAITITGTGKITAVFEGKVFTVETDHVNYQAALQAVRDKDYDKFMDLVDLTRKVKDFTFDGGIKVTDGVLSYNGEEIHNTLSKRILEFMMKDLPFKPLLNFLINVMQNPSKRAVDELYSFLDVGELPFTEDGCFLAMKNVRSDFKDIHSGTFDNSVGKVCEMPRNKVCDDKDLTCSSGLHFCSIAYLPHFSDSNGGKTVIVKVNPKDVVSFPTDYNNTKGRCCRYEVVAEYKDDWRSKIERKENAFDYPLYSSDGGEYQDDDYCDDDDREDSYDECGGDGCDGCGDCSCDYDNSDEPAIVTEYKSEVAENSDFLDGYRDAVTDRKNGWGQILRRTQNEDYRRGYVEGWTEKGIEG